MFIPSKNSCIVPHLWDLQPADLSTQQPHLDRTRLAREPLLSLSPRGMSTHLDNTATCQHALCTGSQNKSGYDHLIIKGRGLEFSTIGIELRNGYQKLLCPGAYVGITHLS